MLKMYVVGARMQVTYLPLVPPIVIFLAKSPMVKNYDLSSVKRAGSGAAPLSKEVELEFRKRLNVPEMKQGLNLETHQLLRNGDKLSNRFDIRTPNVCNVC